MPDSDPGYETEIEALPFYKHKVFLIIAGLILLLAVAGSVYSVITLRDRTAAGPDDSLSPAGDQDITAVAEVLPQQRRNASDAEGLQGTASPVVDPFAEPMKLTGVVIGGMGGNMAIIESGGASYIVSVGDYVDDLWAVMQITRGMAILRAYNQEVTLSFDYPPVTRSLDVDHPDNEDSDQPVEGEEDQEEGT